MNQATMRQTFSKNSDLYCVLLILVVCVLLFFPYLFSNPTPLIHPISDLGTDLTRDVLPNIEAVVDTLKASGELPLWRSFLLSGAPLIGHPSLPLFYPVNWLLLVLPLPLGLNLLAMLDFAWLGIGMYAFLRLAARRPAIPALFGGLALALSPKWIAHLSGGHWFMLAALAWLPWILLAYERYWKSRKSAWLLLLAIGFAAQAMNHLTIFVITGLTLALLSLAYFSRKDWRSWLQKNALAWGAAVLLTAGLIAAQFLPFLELAPYAAHTSENTTFTSLNPAALLVSFFPSDLKYPEWFLFPGLVVLLFAGLSWAYGWTRFEKTWAILGALGLVLSLGDYTPLYAWLFGWNPLLGALRVPTRWWLLTLFALATLAAGGFDLWMKNGLRLNRRARLITAALLGLELLGGLLRIFLGKMFPFDTLATAVLALLLAGILWLGHVRPARILPAVVVLGLVVELNLVAATLIHPQPASLPGETQALAEQVRARLAGGERSYSPGEGFPALALVRFHIDAAEGYDALPLTNYRKFIRLATGCPLVQDATGSEVEQADCLNPRVMRPDWLRLINVRLLLLPREDGWEVRELSAGAGRAFSVGQVAPTTAERCLAELETVDLLAVALVEGGEGLDAAGTLAVRNQKRGVNGEVFQVEVSGAPTLLIRSENWAPGWRARVDGQSVEVMRVDCILQGVWLQPGEHRVEFEYRPYGYPAGAWISAATLLGMGVWLLVARLRKRSQGAA